MLVKWGLAAETAALLFNLDAGAGGGDAAPAAPASSPADGSSPSGGSTTAETQGSSIGAGLDDVRSQIWEKYNAEGDGDDATVPKTAGMKKDEPASGAKVGRAPDGKFTSKSKEAGATDATAAAQDPVDEAGDADQTPNGDEELEPVKAPIVPPPSSWSAPMKAEFANLPEQVQKFIAQRERETSQAISRLGPAAKFGDDIRSVTERHRDYFERTGLHPAKTLDNYLQFDAMLAKDPVSAIRALIENFSVDASQLIDGMPPIPESARFQEVQGRLNAYQTENDQLRNRVRELEYRYQTEEQQRSIVALEGAQSVIDKFAQDNPDYYTLENDIDTIMPRVLEEMPHLSQQELLREAYDRARRANPATFARMQAEERARAQRARQEEEKKRGEAQKKSVEAARRAASANVRGAATPGAQRVPLDTTRAEIAARYGLN